MSSFIDKIIEMDQNAGEQVNKAKIYANQLLSEAETEVLRLDAQYNIKITERLNKAKIEYEKFADEEIAALQGKTDNEFNKLYKNFDEMSEKKGNNIFNAIIMPFN